ncbi:MAG TPA: hypothetical protein VIR60_05155 [Gammaproteobacteria bacterium]
MFAAIPTYRKSMGIDASRPRKGRGIPCLPFVLWLGIMAGLFIWKGANYAEARVLLEFLGWSESSTTHVWWGGAALFGLLTVAGIGCLLYRRFRQS